MTIAVIITDTTIPTVAINIPTIFNTIRIQIRMRTRVIISMTIAPIPILPTISLVRSSLHITVPRPVHLALPIPVPVPFLLRIPGNMTLREILILALSHSMAPSP